MSPDEAMLWLSEKLKSMGYSVSLQYYGFNIPSNILILHVPPKKEMLCLSWSFDTWQHVIGRLRENGHEAAAQAFETAGKQLKQWESQPILPI